MLDAKQFAFDLLKNSSALLALLGGDAKKIVFMYPNDFNVLPIITYSEVGSSTADYYDNMPMSENSVIQIDVWSNTSTTPFCKVIDALFIDALYIKEFAQDVPDPNAKIQHRVMRFSRSFTADYFS